MADGESCGEDAFPGSPIVPYQSSGLIEAVPRGRHARFVVSSCSFVYAMVIMDVAISTG